MRVKYIGRDSRSRVSEANRFKFLPDGYQSTDPRDERDENIKGPLIVFHTYRIKGGKRTIIMVPPDYDFVAAQDHILKHGWIDLSMYPNVSEFYY